MAGDTAGLDRAFLADRARVQRIVGGRGPDSPMGRLMALVGRHRPAPARFVSPRRADPAASLRSAPPAPVYRQRLSESRAVLPEGRERDALPSTRRPHLSATRSIPARSSQSAAPAPRPIDMEGISCARTASDGASRGRAAAAAVRAAASAARRWRFAPPSMPDVPPQLVASAGQPQPTARTEPRPVPGFVRPSTVDGVEATLALVDGCLRTVHPGGAYVDAACSSFGPELRSVLRQQAKLGWLRAMVGSCDHAPGRSRPPSAQLCTCRDRYRPLLASCAHLLARFCLQGWPDAAAPEGATTASARAWSAYAAIHDVALELEVGRDAQPLTPDQPAAMAVVARRHGERWVRLGDARLAHGEHPPLLPLRRGLFVARVTGLVTAFHVRLWPYHLDAVLECAAGELRRRLRAAAGARHPGRGDASGGCGKSQHD